MLKKILAEMTCRFEVYMLILGVILGMFCTSLLLFLYGLGFVKGKEEAYKDDI